jgi:hypothetical protein
MSGANSSLLLQDAALRAEATELLDGRGLRPLLEEYGVVHVVGSHALHLMVWRDLDIYLAMPRIDGELFFELGNRIRTLLHPFKMFLSDYRVGPSEFALHGLYWGIRLGDLRQGAWKIDLHAEDSERCEEMVARCRALSSRLTPDYRARILEIKAAIWNHTEYRKSVTSQNVYDAVLDRGVETPEEFWKYTRRIPDGFSGWTRSR